MLICQDWKNATGLARAFAMGPKESSAVYNLVTLVPEWVCDKLEEMVTTRGMQRFLSHDSIAKGVFNSGWSSGIGSTEAWTEELTNSKNKPQLVTCLQAVCFGR